MIPPKQSAEFAAGMERALAVYARPRDPKRPVICMDEQPVQLARESREPIPEAPGRPACVDHEYRRAGTASIFMFCEPLAGWRQASVRGRRAKVDFAQEVETLLSTRYANSERVTLAVTISTPIRRALSMRPSSRKRLERCSTGSSSAIPRSMEAGSTSRSLNSAA